VNRRPGFVTRDHVVSVPLDHSDPASQPIEVFAREVVPPDKATEDLPWLLYLAGGPGGKAPRPVDTSGWLGAALETYRVLLLDQRGTGRSTPLTARTRPDLSPAELAAYIRCFRADSIVADAEVVRRQLLGDESRWDTLGQSYGGFITLAYLSTAPHGLRRAHVTGGLPSLSATAEEVYRRTFPRMARRTHEFYERYPDDQRTIRDLVEHVCSTDVRLPDGDRLTDRRLRLLGHVLGMNSGMERLHWLLEGAWQGGGLSDGFLLGAHSATAFSDGPLYALQEYIYGAPGGSTGWAADRVLTELPEFAADAEPLLLFGEMMFPWMFEEIAALRPFREAAEVLAAHDEWPALYDPEQLARNGVPVAAAVYGDDVYVDRDLSMETAAAIANLRVWATNEHEHDGLREDPEVFRRLADMTSGRR
jgi:pimeloyl-ACP methyl ester carboxylesterase